MAGQSKGASARLRTLFAAAARAENMTPLKYKGCLSRFCEHPPTVVFFLEFEDDDGQSYYCDIDLNDVRSMKSVMAKNKNAMAMLAIHEHVANMG